MSASIWNPAGNVIVSNSFLNPVNILWYCNDAQRLAVLNYDFSASLDDVLSIASVAADGRPLYFPAGGYLLSTWTCLFDGQAFIGDGIGATIIRHSSPALNLFIVQADNVSFSGIEFQGGATAATNAKFAIFTDLASPAVGTRIDLCKFSGQSAAYGFTSGIKFDTGCDNSQVTRSVFERLWGSTSGFGYGVLNGECNNNVMAGNEVYGSAGRGRHGFYLSSGCTFCTVDGNYIEAVASEGITIYSQGVQPANAYNTISNNRLVGCSTGNVALYSSSISIFGPASNNKIVGNHIKDSAACGIKLDGTSYTTLTDTQIENNIVINSGFVGIDILAAVRGSLIGNYISESSQSGTGTYANIRLVSDSTTASSGWAISGNKSFGSTKARSAFQLNGTAPVPTNLKMHGNDFQICNVTDVELLGTSVCAIDGRIRFSTVFDPGNILAGTTQHTNFTVSGASVGDIVTATHDSDTDGCQLYARVSATDTVRLAISNVTAAGKDITSGTLYVNVWKSAP